MSGKRMSNYAKGRSSLKNEASSPTSHKLLNTTYSDTNKHSKPTVSSAVGRSEAIISLPMIKSEDNDHVLPTYSAVLTQTSENCIVLDEELDSLQLELESLLSVLACRTNIIHNEIDADDQRQEDNKRMKSNAKQSPLSGTRRRNIDKPLSHKGTKVGSNVCKSKNLKRLGVLTGGLCRNPTASPSEPALDLKSELCKPVVIKNDTAFKFWASIEPYCAPLAQTDVDKLIKVISKYEEPLPAIPELGQHYTQRWSAEDLLMEQNYSSTDRVPQKKFDMNLNIPAHIATMLKKTESYNGDIPGPLTQRLLSALLNVPELDNLDQKLNSNSERILRKELITLGIMDEDDFPKPNPDDEVWEETKRVYADLVALNKQNVHKLKELQSAAQLELKKTTLQRKLETVDNQILDIYKKFQLAKLDQRQISAKELEDAEKLLKEQILLNEKITSMPSAGPHWVKLK